MWDIEPPYFLIEFLDNLIIRCARAKRLFMHDAQTLGREPVFPCRDYDSG